MEPVTPLKEAKKKKVPAKLSPIMFCVGLPQRLDYTSVMEHEGKLTSLKTQVESNEKVLQELKELLQTVEVCPTCRRPLFGGDEVCS